MRSEHPILFSGPMVLAILAGRKTMTRRLIKLPRWAQECNEDHEFEIEDGIPYAISKRTGCLSAIECPYGQPGNRLWVKEAWAQRLDRDHLNGTQLYASGVREAWYWADGPGKCCRTGCAGAAGRVRASRFMPRWASRITLEIVSVRVDLLQEISSKDILAEGAVLRDHDDQFGHNPVSAFDGKVYLDLKSLWAAGWNKINGKKYPWASNPYVWIIEFRRA